MRQVKMISVFDLLSRFLVSGGNYSVSGYDIVPSEHRHRYATSETISDDDDMPSHDRFSPPHLTL